MRPRLRPLSIRTHLTAWYAGILLAILVVISALSYSLLRWNLVRDVDTSLTTVARVMRDSGYAGAPAPSAAAAEAAIRGILGPEFYDKLFQVVDPQGTPGVRSAQLRDVLPLSTAARGRATRGQHTFETIRLATGERVRLLTLPILEDGQLTRLLQVGMTFERVEGALARYRQGLLVLVPFALGLAVAGGTLIARSALRPVDEMSQAARRITGEDLSERIALRGTADEIDRLAETLNAMLARLEGAFEQLRRFTADAAHELRTPLTILKGGIEVTLRTERSAPEYREVLASSLEEVERLIRLAEDLLLLSRFSAEVVDRGKRVDLEALVLDVLDAGVRVAHKTGVTVRLDRVTPVVIPGDGSALRRAMLNLVENAVKYTPAGGTVQLALEPGDGHARIQVRDTGVGIAPEDVGRIFQPFVRLEPARSRDTGGAGLGLSIARSIVLAHGGRLSVESTPGAGSTFTIQLPVA
ncbi:MAG: sensor histidine kinase [Candidatus Rokuibacteriota bacterium]